MNTATATETTRFATLSIVRTSGRTIRASVTGDKIELIKAAARALADAGVEVSLKWGATPAGVSLNVAQALVAAGEYDGSAVAYRLLNNAAGEEVVWVLMETSTGRGYIAAWYPPASRMQVITNRPTNPRYEFGLARLRKHEPIEGAVITQDWVSA